jgi:hypothetical protein
MFYTSSSPEVMLFRNRSSLVLGQIANALQAHEPVFQKEMNLDDTQLIKQLVLEPYIYFGAEEYVNVLLDTIDDEDCFK